MVEIVLPDREAMGPDIDLPNVRDMVFGEVVVHASADVEERVLVAARDPQQIENS
jgi:hypothetical protein